MNGYQLKLHAPLIQINLPTKKLPTFRPLSGRAIAFRLMNSTIRSACNRGLVLLAEAHFVSRPRDSHDQYDQMGVKVGFQASHAIFTASQMHYN